MSELSAQQGPALGSQAKRGGLTTIVGQGFKALVQLCGLVVLSRILSPEDFGVVAMLTIFVMLGELLRDFGLSQAAMQAKVLTRQQATNLTWVNVGLGSLLAVSLAAAAPLLANMFDEPAIREIAPWVAICFIINAAQAQFQVRLARDSKFGTLAATDLVAQILGLVIAVSVALLGHGYWALVAQMISSLCITLVLRAILCGWLPGVPRKEPGMLTLYKFGTHVGLAQLFGYAASNADSYVIGLRWGAGPLGIYNRAFQLLTVPANQLLAPLTNVALPLLARSRHEAGDFYGLLWKAQVAISTILIFGFSIVAALAFPIVDVLLGSEWRRSAPILSALCVGGAAQTLSFMSYWAFLASGHSRQLFYYNLATKTTVVLMVVLGSSFGLVGVAWGYSLGLVASWPVSLWWLRRCDGMPVSRFFYSGFHVVGASIAAGAVCSFIYDTLSLGSESAEMAIAATCGLIVYAVAILTGKSTRDALRGFAQTVRPRQS